MKNTILAIILTLLVLAVCITIVEGARGEVDGGIVISDAPNTLRIKWYRVDVQAMGEQMKAEIWVPPDDVTDILLYDGWHVLHAWWANMGDHILAAWHSDDIRELDGTVGIYLIILEGDW